MYLQKKKCRKQCIKFYLKRNYKNKTEKMLILTLNNIRSQLSCQFERNGQPSLQHILFDLQKQLISIHTADKAMIEKHKYDEMKHLIRCYEPHSIHHRKSKNCHIDSINIIKLIYHDDDMMMMAHHVRSLTE